MKITGIRPNKPAERIEQIDILRGVALLGILLVNVFGYHASFYHFGDFYRGLESAFQRSVYDWVVNLGSDKFILMFSILFGYGFWMLEKKFKDNHGDFRAFYLRRMIWLCVFGLLHVVFLWAGDILLIYGILGIVLLMLRKLKTRTLMILSVAFYFFTTFYLVLRIFVPALPDPMATLTNMPMQEIKDIYANGGFFKIMEYRINEYIVFRNINLLYYMPKVLGLFIFGYIAGRQKFLDRIYQKYTESWVFTIASVIIGLVLLLRLGQILNFLTPPDSKAVMPVYIGLYEVGNIFLGLGYILIVLLLAKTTAGLKVLGSLKYVGRMALTNYLLQSLIFTTIFYGYGFGYFGNTNPSSFLVWALIAFVGQIIISKLWLMRYRFGPMEFIWRKLSYGNWPRKQDNQ